jgi:uncharacterized protein
MARLSPEELQVLIVAKLLESVPGCLAVYRFGSWLTDAERPDSDIDIAFLAPEALPQVRRWELAQSLASLAGRDVDLVDLLTASTVLRMQVVAHGVLLHESDPRKVAQFADTVFSSYARLNEERREILADVLRRGNVYGK